MRRATRYVVLAAAIASLAIAGVGLLLGTSIGTRFIWRYAVSYLPAEVSVADVHGSLLAGVVLQDLAWSGDVAVGADRVTAKVALLPLLGRRVSITSLSVRGLSVAGGDSPAESEQASAPLQVDLPIPIEIHELSVRDFLLRWGDVEQRIDAVDAAGRVAGSAAELRNLRVSGDGLFLHAAGAAELVPSLPIELDAQWAWTSPSAVEYSGVLELDGDADEYRVVHELIAPYAVSTTGRVLDGLGAWRAELLNEWAELELSVGERMISSAAGSLQVGGNVDRFALTGLFDLQTGEYGADIRFDSAGDLGGMRIDRLELASPLGAVELRGDVSWASGIDWSTEGDVTSIDASALLGTLEGSIDARAIVASGAVDAQQRVRIDARIGSIEGTLNGRPVTGDAALMLFDRDVERLNFNVASEQSRLVVAGSASDTLDLTAEFAIGELAEVLPEAQGALTGTARVLGPADDPSLSLNAQGTGVALAAFSAETVSLNLGGQRSAHSIDVALVRSGTQLAAAAAGRLVDSEWRGALSDLSIVTDDWGTWDLDAASSMVVSAERTELSSLCLSGRESGGSACVELSRDAPNAFSVLANARGVPLAALPLTIPQGVVLDGVLEMSADARFGAGITNADLALSVVGGSATTSYDGESLSTRFEQADATLSVVDNQLEANAVVVLGEELGRLDASLQVADIVTADAVLSGEIGANVNDLSLVSMFVPDVRDVRGGLNGTLRIGGTRDAPRFGGTVRLNDGAFAIPRAGLELDEVGFELKQISGGRFGVEGSARSGEGALRFRGEAELAGDADAVSWIDIDGENVQILRLPDQQIVASPDVRMRLESGLLSVAGEIDVPAAHLTLDSLPAAAERASPDTVVHGDDSVAAVQRPIQIDVRATLGEAVHVAGFGLSTRVEGGLRVSGERDAQLVGVGRLDLRDGEYEAYGQTLEIERGELMFNGPLDRPQLDIRASRKAGDVTAGVDLTGTPDQLRSVVFSEPALSDAEALSYLLTGRPLRSASSSEGDTLNQAAFALGLSRAGAVTEQIRSTLGLETLAVEGGSDSGRIVAGKQLGGRLFLEYGYGLVDQLGTLLLRYQLSDRVILETSSGSATALDVVYSVKKD